MKTFSPSDQYSLRITVIYLLISALWIIFSDNLVSILFEDPEFIATVQTYKGLFFVSVTGLLLYFLIRNSTVSIVNSRERLKQILRQKQTLLSELHHRVKNNLAIIAGLIELQSDNLENEKKDILKTTQYRIYSLANIQELLFQEENLNRVPFHEHLHHITNSINGSETPKLVDIEFDELVVNINQAVPLSLLINEFFSQIRLNCSREQDFKASFRLTHNEDKKVHVRFRLLNIPPIVFEQLKDTSKHLEATLINIYTKQLKGRSQWILEQDVTTFELEFEKSDRPGSSASMNVSKAS